MLLVAHTGRPDIDITARRRPPTLAEAGIDLVASAGESRELDLTVFDPADDGTGPPRRSRWCWRSAATAPCCGPRSRPGRCRAPVLGINLGRVGFLTEVDVDQLDAGAARRSSTSATGCRPG